MAASGNVSIPPQESAEKLTAPLVGAMVLSRQDPARIWRGPKCADGIPA
jgi:hypothetical protein